MPARWYVVHVHSGFEKKVMSAIQEKAEKMKIAEQFEEILVPTEGVVEVRRGQKVNTERKFFPGYVLVKMDLTDESWHLVRNVAKVTNFLGGGSRPQPISEAEAERLISQMKEGAESRVVRRLPTRSARACASPTARSPRSTARSRKWTRNVRA